jgi:tetratricopeptide (TPR) repeat protein
VMREALRKNAHRSCAHRRLICISCVLVLVAPLFAGSALVNWSSGLLLRSVLQSDRPPYEYPHQALGEKARSVLQALDLSRRALWLDPNSPNIQWSYGRAALAAGLDHEAARVLLLADSALMRNPLRYLDALAALSHVGDDGRVVELYESSGHSDQVNKAAREEIILSYLRESTAMLRTGAVDRAIAYLEQAVSLRPNDIYANLLLWRTPVSYGHPDAADRARQRLQFPDVLANDARLLELAGGVVPQLLTSGLWSAERGHAVLSFWAWRYPEVPAVAQLAQTLIELFPSDARWPFYLAEIYQRTGRLSEAQDHYSLAATLAADGLPVQQRMDQLRNTEQRSAGISPPTDQLEQEDRTALAHMLGLAPDSIHLGSNVIQSSVQLSGTQDLLSGWKYFVMGGVHNWSFQAGEDSLEGPGTVRIANAWWPEVDDDSSYIPYAQYETAKIPVSSAWLMLSLEFRVESSPDSPGAGVLMATASPDLRPYFASAGLPDTRGKWVRLLVVGPVPEGSERLFLLIRNTSACSLWFRNPVARFIDLAAEPATCSVEPCMQFLELAR